MSRCYACDKNLSDYELTRKLVHYDGTITYPDLCNRCFTIAELSNFCNVVERHDIEDDTDTDIDISTEHIEFLED